jgi:hypothetical protein
LHERARYIEVEPLYQRALESVRRG